MTDPETGGAEDAQGAEVLPPDAAEGLSPQLYAEITATVSNYTDRPDLLLAVLEKHDPGFIERFNRAAQQHQSEDRQDRLRFGKIQAYVSLGLQVIAAISILGLVGYSLYLGQGFWTLIALAMFYAVSQSGSRGFVRLVEQIGHALNSRRASDRDSATD